MYVKTSPKMGVKSSFCYCLNDKLLTDYFWSRFAELPHCYQIVDWKVREESVKQSGSFCFFFIAYLLLLSLIERLNI